MNDLVTQIVCGARWPDFQDNGWVQLLVFVILAVIYALGNIVTAKKGKAGEGAQEPAKGGFGQAGFQPVAKGRPGKRQITEGPRIPHTPRTGHIVTVQPVSATRTADKSDSRPEVAEVQPAPISMGKQIIELAAKTVSVENTGIPILTEVARSERLVEILSDYADPEKVRKVILHYEILGKPLSLRESPENIIGS
jgi:hypothetical protein